MDNVFNVKINVMEDVNLDIINDIEKKCTFHEDLTEEEVKYYLSYIVYQVRKMLFLNKQKDAKTYNYDFMCDTAQSMIARYFEKLDISYKAVFTQEAISSDVCGHNFLIANFLVDGENKNYIIDPTFNQFFDEEKCQEDNFKVFGEMVLKTPDLGYFAAKEDVGTRKIIINLLKNGYVLEDEASAKAYGDLFYKTKTGMINVLNSDLQMSGFIYIKGFNNSAFQLTYTEEELSEMGLSLEPIYKNDFKLKK